MRKKSDLSGEWELRIHTPTHSLQIMVFAVRIDFDLFILLLNNIVFPTDNMPPDQAGQTGTQVRGPV
jgi:hypothetical protein